MSANEAYIWVALANACLSVGAVAYAWLTSGSRANSAEIKALDARLDHLEDRAAKIEGDIRHMPDREIVQRMEITLTQMDGRIAVLSERLQPVAAISERLHDFLLETAKR